jgi:hypothetical protein
VVGQAHGHAEFAQVAVGTCDFDRFRFHGVLDLEKLTLRHVKSLAYTYLKHLTHLKLS